MGLIDWTVLAAYLLGTIALGAIFARRQHDAADYFGGGRAMPTWAVSLSIVATSLSAGTFIGVPEIAYRGDLTYLMMSVGSTLGGILAAVILIPPLYHARTITIYGYLGQRFGAGAVTATSVVFLLGQLLAAGSRLFIAAIAVSFMLYGDILMGQLVVAIVVLGVVGTIYTAAGGIRAVIWTDVAQLIIMGGAGMVCLWLLWSMIPMPLGELLEALRSADGGSKLTLVDTSFDLGKPYTLWGAVFAVAVLNMAQYGVDHDFVQRMLTCKSAWRASWSLVVSRIISLPVVVLYLAIGLLLWIFYTRPDLLGDAAATEILEDTRKVFPQYLFNHLPPGLIGLTMAGLFAAAMSSFDSAANAMASSFISDLYLPWKRRQPANAESPSDAAAELKASRWAVAVMGGLLTLFAAVAALLQSLGDQSLVDFALGVLTFAYAGLLGVFLTAVLTRRGNVLSVVAALVVGALAVLAVQPYMLSRWSMALFGYSWQLAWPWWMIIGGTAAFLTCAAPRGRRQSP